MERLSEFDTFDPVSDLLRAVRVRSTVYCRSVMRAPWGFGVEAHGNPAFHVVTSGRAWLQIDDAPDQTELVPGDLVVLPAGRRHWLRDDPKSPAGELEEILASTPADAHSRLRHGGDGTRTSLLCGGFELDGVGSHPILGSLPPLLVVRGSGGHPVPWLAATISMLSAETSSNAPGAEAVVARLADSLLTQALRVGLLELQAKDAPHVRALQDPQIAQAVALIHSRPGRAWAVGELASNVALSRSEFAARFRSLVGESPIRYITRTRLAHAAALLRTSDASLAEIAARSGYGTPFSFGKAFKRTFGIAPGVYRGQANGQPKLTVAATQRREA
jgi:AraC family transcriptional regulator, alkane utilization regulator